MTEFSIAVLCLAGSVFAASSAGKLSSRVAYRSFRDSLAGSGLIPRRAAPGVAALAGAESPTAAGLLAAALAGAEAATAAGLLAAAGLTAAAAPGAAWLAGAALTAAALLTALLALGVALIVRRGTRVSCACFGVPARQPLGRVHLARNLCLLAVACAGLAGVPLAHGRPPAAAAVLAGVTGAIAALLFVRWEDLAGLFAPLPAPAARRDS